MPSSNKPAEADAPNLADAANPEGEQERLKTELQREHQMYLRALADFDNYRARVERESATAEQKGKRELIAGLLPVVDGFEQALQFQGNTPSGVLEGVQAIHRNLLNLLMMHGVTPFDSLGQRFDPALHEAIGVVPGGSNPAGTVAEQLRPGYRFRDEVLRPARVRVAQ